MCSFQKQEAKPFSGVNTVPRLPGPSAPAPAEPDLSADTALRHNQVHRDIGLFHGDLGGLLRIEGNEDLSHIRCEGSKKSVIVSRAMSAAAPLPAKTTQGTITASIFDGSSCCAFSGAGSRIPKGPFLHASSP